MERAGKGSRRKPRDTSATILERVGLDMTALLTEKPFGAIHFWKDEVERMLEILQRRERHNVLLEGPPGVGKRTMLLRLATQLKAGNVPDHFRRYRIFEITLSSILSLIEEPEDFERILFLALREASARRDVLVYVNQLENFLGTGGTEPRLFDGSYIVEMATRRCASSAPSRPGRTSGSSPTTRGSSTRWSGSGSPSQARRRRRRSSRWCGRASRSTTA
jgi:ATP-dependent Clp protease ATP-binding subunit ClpA